MVTCYPYFSREISAQTRAFVPVSSPVITKKPHLFVCDVSNRIFCNPLALNSVFVLIILCLFRQTPVHACVCVHVCKCFVCPWYVQCRHIPTTYCVLVNGQHLGVTFCLPLWIPGQMEVRLSNR